MVKVLDKTSKSVLVKMTIQEFNSLSATGIIQDTQNDFSGYEFVFDAPVKASELIKNIK